MFMLDEEELLNGGTFISYFLLSIMLTKDLSEEMGKYPNTLPTI